MRKSIKNKFNYILSAVAAISILAACTTDSLDPTLSQEKNSEGSITKVSNLYSLLKGAHNVLTGSGYYGRDMIATNEVRSDNVFPMVTQVGLLLRVSLRTIQTQALCGRKLMKL
ncbi:hypothetical protein [Flagellimonas abyssi]|uniref:hypothetical protein n=1 Tax=Flagellimonas abyssi TaxID=2864871 RepID=UPI001C66ABDA|nr:hypothetical protein [Allomuricauda abyssi]